MENGVATYKNESYCINFRVELTQPPKPPPSSRAVFGGGETFPAGAGVEGRAPANFQMSPEAGPCTLRTKSQQASAFLKRKQSTASF